MAVLRRHLPFILCLKDPWTGLQYSPKLNASSASFLYVHTTYPSEFRLTYSLPIPAPLRQMTLLGFDDLWKARQGLHHTLLYGPSSAQLPIYATIDRMQIKFKQWLHKDFESKESSFRLHVSCDASQVHVFLPLSSCCLGFKARNIINKTLRFVTYCAVYGAERLFSLV